MTVKHTILEINNKNGIPYLITRILTKDFLSQLVTYAHTDQQVISQTSDANRFSTIDTAELWLKKTKKSFYLLTAKSDPNNLAGVIWFEELKLPEIFAEKYNINWTFGIRVYEKHRSQGLALPLMQVAFKDFLQQLKDKKIWLSTKISNATASSLYEKFGFKKIGEYQGKNYYIFSPSQE